MRIDRRSLLRQFGAAAATTALYSTLTESDIAVANAAMGLIRLNRNESAYGPSEKAKAAFFESFTECNRYPGEQVENLRAAVADVHGVKPENITLGCGSTELLRMVAESCLGPGKNLVMASPTFELIADAARLEGAGIRTIPLSNVYAHDL